MGHGQHFTFCCLCHYDLNSHFKNLNTSSTLLRLLFVLATEHTLLRMFSNIWRQILLPGNLHDAAF